MCRLIFFKLLKDFLTIYKETSLRSTPDRASSSTLLLFLTAWRMVVAWPVFSFAEDRSRKVRVGVGMIAITKEMWMFKKFVLLGFNSSIQAVAYYGRILWSWLWSKLGVIRWYFSRLFLIILGHINLFILGLSRAEIYILLLPSFKDKFSIEGLSNIT